MQNRNQIDHHLQDGYKLMELMNKEKQNKEELEFILGKLEELSFFNQFVDQQFKGTQRKDILEFCSKLRLEYFKAADVIFEEQDPSNDKLYIILYGSVTLMRRKKMDSLQVSVPITDDKPERSPPAQTMKLQQLLNAKRFSSKMMLHAHQDKGLNQFDRQYLKELYGDQLRIMKKGEGFGDKALIENAPRSLTIAAYSQDLFLVVLLKEDFAHFQREFERQIKEKQQLVFGVFRNVNNEYSTARLETMIYSCQTLQFEKGHYLSIEDELGEYFYIIQSGDITISKKGDKKMVQLCIVSTGHLLGEEIVVNKSGYYEYTSQVSSLQAKVMVIQANQFATKFPDECRKQIIQDFKSKHSNRKEQFIILQQDHMQTPSNRQVQNQNSMSIMGKSNYEGIKFQRIDTSVNPRIESKQRDIKLNKNFLKHYSNPTLQSFCVQSIVDVEVKLSKARICPRDNRQLEEFDFGSKSNEEIKRQRHLFENKLNWRKPYQNFLHPQEKVLPLAIKREFVRIHKKRRFISTDMGITSYSGQAPLTEKCKTDNTRTKYQTIQ